VPDIPEEAVQAAASAISRMLFSGQPEYGTWMEHDEDLARVAVEAAAPVLAAQARASFVAELEKIADKREPNGRVYTFEEARLIRSVARQIGEARG
jgi:hypothetical protein